MTKTSALGRFVAGAILLWVTSIAAANGKGWPMVKFPKTPAIPTQRAMIVFRDGAETLVVESTFDTESPGLGWVLPLPAEPTKLEVADPGMLKSLSISLRPEVIDEDKSLVRWLVLALLFLVPFPVAIITAPGPFSVWSKRGLLVPMYELFLVLLTTCLFILKGTLGVGGGPGIAGVSVKQTQQVGSYDVSVLTTNDPEALSNWLTDNSFTPLAAAEKPVVQDYISRKWCFVVAKLRREGGGPATPHPIAATFPAGTPIYPMKLTGLAGSSTHVELFIVAGRRAKAEGFECIAADTFHVDASGALNRRDKRALGKYLLNPCYAAANSDLVIGSPDAGALLWPGCTVTKLTADLAPQQMDRDIDIGLYDAGSHRKKLYTVPGRNDVVRVILLTGAIALLFLSTFVFRYRRRGRPWQWCVLAAILAGTIIGAVAAYGFLPIVPAADLESIHPIVERGRISGLLRAFETEEDIRRNFHAGLSDAQLRDLPRILKDHRFLRYRLTNPLTNKAMRYERSPGNYSIRKVDDKTYLCFYDLEGREYRVQLAPGPEEF